MMSDTSLQKVLMVEDEKDIRTIAQIALEDIGGFQVQYCSCGKSALEKAPIFKPDLILLDVMMPGIDGVATFGELRKIPSLINTPVIFMTAKVQTSEIAYYKRIGGLDVIPKPFDPMTLSDCIQRIWEKHESR